MIISRDDAGQNLVDKALGNIQEAKGEGLTDVYVCLAEFEALAQWLGVPGLAASFSYNGLTVHYYEEAQEEPANPEAWKDDPNSLKWLNELPVEEAVNRLYGFLREEGVQEERFFDLAKIFNL